MFGHLILWLVASIALASCSPSPNNCNGTAVVIEKGDGYLYLTPTLAGQNCRWQFKAGSPSIFLKNIEDVKVQFTFANNSTPVDTTGVFLFGTDTPTVDVTLSTNKTPPFFEVRYNTERHLELPVGDIRTLKVSNLGAVDQSLPMTIRGDSDTDTLLFTKVLTSDLNARIETNGYNVDGTVLQKTTESNLDLQLTVNPKLAADITTGYALKNCSGYETLSLNTNFRSLAGSAVTDSYCCLKLYDLTNQYVELDFTPFAGLVDHLDTLTISNHKNSILLNRYNADSYSNKIISLNVGPVSIEYYSPLRVSPENIETVIGLTPRAAGGVSTLGPLTKVPKGTDLSRFVLTVKSPKFPQIALGSKNSLPKSTVLKIYQGNPDVPLAEFTSADKLPEALAVDDRSLIAEFSGQGLDSLSKEYKFEEVSDGCNRISSTDLDSYHFNTNSSCTWIIAPKAQQGSLLLYLWNMDKMNNSTCVDLISSEGKKTSICGTYRYKSFPAIALPANLKYYLTSPAGSSFTATHSYLASRDSDSYTFNITSGSKTLTSIDYPAPYPLGNYKKDHLFVQGKYYLAMFNRLELNEKDSFKLVDSKGKITTITEANYLQQGDVLLEGNSSVTFNSVMDVNIIDLANIEPDGRAYSVNVSAFDAYKYVNDIKSNQSTSEGCQKSCLIILTSRNKPESPFQKRISFRILQANNQTSLTEIRTYDDRSARDVRRLFNNTKDESSSDTIVVIYRFKEDAISKNLTLPLLTIDYTWHDCETQRFCDNNSRCIREDWVCNGTPECNDLADEKYCNGTQPTPPKIIETGMGGVSVFILSLFMFIVGIVVTMYGPTAYHFLENYMRSGQYSTFVSE